MANRSWSSEAIVLSVKNFGEGHRNAVLLLPETDHSCKLMEAAVFGGPKSRLRGLVSPYQSGTVWIYSNPAKNSHKITDFKVSDYRAGLRENLTRLWCASFAAELAIHFKGNIGWDLFNFFLTGIASSSEAGCKTALLRFLWRTIIFSGLAPDTECCCRCGTKIGLYAETAAYPSKQDSACSEPIASPRPSALPFESAGTTAQDLFYLPNEDACACKNCTQKGEPFFYLSKESLHYLSAIRYLPPAVSREQGLSVQAYSELKRFLFCLIQSAAGKNFKTLDSGIFLF